VDHKTNDHQTGHVDEKQKVGFGVGDGAAFTASIAFFDGVRCIHFLIRMTHQIEKLTVLIANLAGKRKYSLGTV